ncbi:hypothetical protein IL306_014109 [Fusarium sp. DS 682]|nr:hypothetical protein IL306_014109 [Fusarium sp. DS 682]
MAVYIREYCMWKVWQEQIEKIPNAALLEHALEKRRTVPELLREHRPLLCTDQILHEDKDKGVEFLRGLQLPGVVDEFFRFTGGALLDFLRLDIEWEFLQDAIDRQQLMGADQLGWLDPEKMERLRAGASTTVPPSGPFKNPELGDPFLGTIKRRLTPPPVEDAPVEDATAQDGGYDTDNTHDANEDENEGNNKPRDKGKQPAGPEPQAEGTARDATRGPEPLPFLIPGPLGEHPLPYQQRILQIAASRVYSLAYTNVYGPTIKTLVEEDRQPRVQQYSAYCPQGLQFIAKQQQIRGFVGAGSRAQSLRRPMECNVGNGEGSSRQEARGSVPLTAGLVPERAPLFTRQGLEPQTVLTDHFNESLMSNPTYADTIKSQDQEPINLEEDSHMAQSDGAHDEEQYPTFTPAPEYPPSTFIRSNGSTLALNQHPAPQVSRQFAPEHPYAAFTGASGSGPLPNQSFAPVVSTQFAPIADTPPTEQYRQMPISNWSDLPTPENTASTPQTGASQDPESDDEDVDPMTMSIDVPETEEDGDYNPKKGAPRMNKKATKKGGRGRVRKVSFKKGDSEARPSSGRNGGQK